jgi:fluoride exporter
VPHGFGKTSRSRIAVPCRGWKVSTNSISAAEELHLPLCSAQEEGRVRIAWAIAIGAAIGGVSRYYLAAAVQQRFGVTFPWGTLLINVTGSLLLGFIIRYALAAPAVSVEVRAFLTTGFCGGYTTFSTYSFETATLLEEGQYSRAGAYAVGSVLLAIIATFCGFLLARELIAFRERV